MTSAALVPLVLMLMASPLGGFDVIYFHIWKFRLYRRPHSRWETVTHLARGVLFASGLALLVSFEFRGAWFWLMAGVFVLDFINSVADVLLEPASRAPLGGLPPAEYLIHAIGCTMSGAIAASFLVMGWDAHALPTELAPLATGALPEWLVRQVWLTLPGAALLTAIEGGLMLTSLRRHNAPAPALA